MELKDGDILGKIDIHVNTCNTRAGLMLHISQCVASLQTL